MLTFYDETVDAFVKVMSCDVFKEIYQEFKSLGMF